MRHDCVMAVLRCDDAVVMCHRRVDRTWFPGVWDFPGGHIEPHETPQQALVRELHEELGVRIEAPERSADEILVFEVDQVRLSVWFIDYVGSVENGCPDEHDDVRWVSRSELANLELADAAYLPLVERAFGTR